jgi:O-antigen/teichoic acid export membrane protein
LRIRLNINNITGLQVFQLLRFTAFLIISIVFAKGYLTTKEIGDFEFFMFIASAISFFWVTGIIQTLLPLYNNNQIFKKLEPTIPGRSPEIFNAFILLCFFSLLFGLLFLFLGDYLYVFNGMQGIEHNELLFLYILFSNPTPLVEYIYLLRNKSSRIFQYGIISFVVQLVLVIGPVAMGLGLKSALWGLVVASGLRFVWLIFLLRKYALFKLSFTFIKMHVSLGLPLMLSALLTGSAQYIDGLIVSLSTDEAKFAIFRFGAKELPLVVMLASGLSSAMLPQFHSTYQIKHTLYTLKEKSRKLMHYLFPLSCLIMLLSKWLYGAMFNEEFYRSADVFMVYLLLILARLVFPQTVLIGHKKTNILMLLSVVEVFLNVVLSLILLQFYGIVGVALATVMISVLEKGFLVGYNYYKLGISPRQYIPVKTYIVYSIIILILFALIDHRVIHIY